MLLRRVSGLYERFDLVVVDGGSRLDSVMAACAAGAGRLVGVTTPDRIAQAAVYALLKVTRGRFGALPTELVVREDELSYEVDVLGGHKTGHYLDQRENRRLFARRAAGRRVLDAFCYDGLFGLRAALAGATDVLCVDQSADALARVQRNAQRNGVAERVRVERADVLKDLRARHTAGERFGLIVLDPPPFARSRTEVAGAERGYREVNSRALRLLDPGGQLGSASCSFAIDAAHYLNILAQSAQDAGRAVWLEELRGADLDHPVLLGLPESGYLKCAFLRGA